jgi:hypothetical protein
VGCCEYGDKPSGSGAMELVITDMDVGFYISGIESAV